MEDADCSYCGSDPDCHDPVRVERPESESPGWFCNYACLYAYIEENELVYGTACQWSPGGS